MSRGRHRNPFRSDDADHHQKKGSQHHGRHRKDDSDAVSDAETTIPDKDAGEEATKGFLRGLRKGKWE